MDSVRERMLLYDNLKDCTDSMTMTTPVFFVGVVCKTRSPWAALVRTRATMVPGLCYES